MDAHKDNDDASHSSNRGNATFTSVTQMGRLTCQQLKKLFVQGGYLRCSLQDNAHFTVRHANQSPNIYGLAQHQRSGVPYMLLSQNPSNNMVASLVIDAGAINPS